MLPTRSGSLTGGARGIGAYRSNAALQPSTTTARALVVRFAGRLREALRWARFNTGTRQTDEYVRGLAKAVLSSQQNRAPESIAALAVDAAFRGTSLADAKAPARELDALVEEAWRASHPCEPLPSLKCAHMEEEAAQAERELAETAFTHDPTPANREWFIRARARYEVADAQLESVIRAEAID